MPYRSAQIETIDSPRRKIQSIDHPSFSLVAFASTSSAFVVLIILAERLQQRNAFATADAVAVEHPTCSARIEPTAHHQSPSMPERHSMPVPSAFRSYRVRHDRHVDARPTQQSATSASSKARFFGFWLRLCETTTVRRCGIILLRGGNRGWTLMTINCKGLRTRAQSADISDYLRFPTYSSGL